MSKQTIIAATGKHHTASIIFSHGLGDTAAGWAPFAHSVKSKFPHIKWILPTASSQPVTLNGGMPMPSWFDIRSLAPQTPGYVSTEDEAGMLISSQRISQYISDEVEAGIPSDRIVVGGFSQGAVIALLTGITSERRLAGLISLSGFLGLSEKVHLMQTDHANKLPIFWGHGEADQVVHHKWGKASADKLKELNFTNLEFNTYKRMGHSLCDQEQSDLEDWLRKTLPAI